MRRSGEEWQSKVLRALRRQDGPMSAYDILEVLRATDPKIAPPTVYRALAALADSGQVHRLESLNSYITCRCDQHDGDTLMAICGDCGHVEERPAPDVLRKLDTATRKIGFAPLRHVIEVHGTCADCIEEGDTA